MTTLLLDTHVVIWAADSPARLSKPVRDLLRDGDQRVVVSAASIAEMTIKVALRRLQLPDVPVEMCRRLDFLPVPLTWRHAEALSSLPPLHRDPFDRLLLATALADGLTLVTGDEQILRYPDVDLLAA